MVLLEIAILRYAVQAAKYTIPLIWLVLLAGSCSSTRFLEDGQYLLKKNSLTVKHPKKQKDDISYELSTLYLQKPNTNWFFFFSRERQYFKMRGIETPNAFQRFRRNTLGEPPAIYSDSLTTQTAQDMQRYLHYKGYLQAEVIPQHDARRKRIKVNYYALTGHRFVIDTVIYQSSDSSIHELLQTAQAGSLFQPGQPLDLSQYNPEKQRVTDYLRNTGYAEFYQTQIGELQLDTFQRQHHANLYFTVYPPYGDTVNRQYYIGDVDVYQDFAIDDSNIVGDTTIAGLRFFLSDRGFIVNPNVLRKAISLRPGELFSQSNLVSTTNQLSALGVFRFVRIKQTPDPEQSDVIHLTLQLTPNYFFEVNAALEFSYTNRSNNSGNPNLLGLLLSPGVLHRNLNKGAELLTANLSFGTEVAPGEIGNTAFFNTLDFRAEADVSLPVFVDYLGIWRTLYRVPLPRSRHLISRDFYLGLRQKAKTHVKAGYEYLLIFDWYRYSLINASYGIEWQPSRNEQFLITHFAINILNPTTSPRFDVQLNENGFLQRSFGQQVFFSLLFREFNFVKRSPTSLKGRTDYLSANMELVGAEILALNEAYNAIFDRSAAWEFSQGVGFSQYAKVELDLRRQKKFASERSFSARFNIGAAIPFGNTTDVPYVKQFFVGGANSMRAWAPRGLGPGGYQDPLADDPANNFRLFQTGDFKMEMNAEYRFPILLWFKGAAFVDVGNIWTFRPDPERPGSEFRFSRQDKSYPFYKELAVAGGLGLRVDLSFFIFRFDVGLKLRYNAPVSDELNPPESAWWNDFQRLTARDFGLNLGLGFPF